MEDEKTKVNENNRNNKGNYQYITNHAKIFYYSVNNI